MRYQTYSFHTQQGTSEFLNRFNYLKRHFITFFTRFYYTGFKNVFQNFVHYFYLCEIALSSIINTSSRKNKNGLNYEYYGGTLFGDDRVRWALHNFLPFNFEHKNAMG